MTLPFQFAAVTQAIGQDLDNDFNAVGAMGVVACTVAGTNALVLTPLANQPDQTVYADNRIYACIAANTNNAATTARVGALSILNVYLDTASGPAALGGGEIVAGNYVMLVYDSTLNSGSGGFHLLGSIASSEILDLIGNIQGDMLYRGATVWGALAPGLAGRYLTTGGAAANPAWSNLMGETGTTITMQPVSGGTLNIKSATALLSNVSSGATATNLIPDGAVLMGLSTRVTGTITGSGVTGYTVGDGSDVDRWGAITGTAIATTSSNADWTTTVNTVITTTSVVITATGGVFTAGAIRIVAWYFDCTPPTS